MIPKAFIENWQKNAPWQTPDMVEQDLIINKALVCLYQNQLIKENLVFRGGTALNKIYIKPASRYSEDIDLVQIKAGPVGEIISTIREVLEWLGKPNFDSTKQSAKLLYRYKSTNEVPMRVKIEINTAENFQVLDLNNVLYSVDSEWFKGECTIPVYQLEELMATKLRALYQRRKGRDLFDLWFVFNKGLANIDNTIKIFHQYCSREKLEPITKEIFEKNLELKRLNKDFKVDMNVLLSNLPPYNVPFIPGQDNWNFDEAFEYVMQKIIIKI